MQPKYRMANEPIIYEVDALDPHCEEILGRIRWSAQNGEYKEVQQKYDYERDKMVCYCWPANTKPKKKEKRQSTWRRRIK